MARNVEIKASVTDLKALHENAAALAAEDPVQIPQDDTFFNCDNGRLKLRAFSDGSGELIFYRRSNEGGPKESFYLRSETSDPAVLRESLSLAYGEAGRVQKVRTLYLIGRTRVHLDQVTNLGEFVELEVVLEDAESIDSGVSEAHRLMHQLGIGQEQLVEGAYVDLLKARAGLSPAQT